VLFLLGILLRHPTSTRVGWAIAQAELIGALISSSYKAVTGRVHPPFRINTGVDLSHDFRFGFLRGGVFWGWPSSHTTIAFAMAATVVMLLPKQRWLGTIAILYASYIGIGVSMNIHWFSDFAAGLIIGTVIGVVVGKSFSDSV
jgi:membrane-associated phospholipid phosphatase